MLQPVSLYFEDAFPGLSKRWWACSDSGAVTVNADTAAEALEVLALKLTALRDEKRRLHKVKNRAR